MSEFIINENNILKFDELHFYWRVSDKPEPYKEIPSFLPLDLGFDINLSLITQSPSENVLDALAKVYKLGYNIGYLQDDFSFEDGYKNSFKKFITKNVKLDNSMKIVEIGCGGASLLKDLKNEGFDVSGVDPSPIAFNKCREYGINLIQEFYDSKKISKYDFLFHHNVLEHVENPLNFMQQNFENLNQGGYVAVAVPDCTNQIISGDLSMIWHEHISYFDDNSLFNLMAAAGFIDIRVSKSSYGGLLYCSGLKDTVKPQQKLKLNNNKFEDFVKNANVKFSSIANLVNVILEQKNETLGVYVPLRFISYLSVLKLPKDKLDKIRFFDDDKSSLGKYYDGFSIKIENLKCLRDNPPDNVLICSENFFSKIKNNIIENTNDYVEIISLNSL